MGKYLFWSHQNSHNKRRIKQIKFLFGEVRNFKSEKLELFGNFIAKNQLTQKYEWIVKVSYMHLHLYLNQYFLHYLIALGISKSLYYFGLKASFSRHNRPTNYSKGFWNGHGSKRDQIMSKNRLFSNKRPESSCWLISLFKIWWWS